MKNRMFPITVVCCVLVTLVMSVGISRAENVTTTLPVSLTLTVGGCSVQTTSVNFGSLPSSADAAGTGTITVTCSSGTPYTVTLAGGLRPGNTHRFMANATGATIAYDLYKDSANTQVWGDSGFASTYPHGTAVVGTGTGSGQPLTVFGKTLLGTVSVPGTYTDSVVVTVIF